MRNTPPTFDEQVAALRGKVVPKCRSGLKKSEATPEQWAARLDHTANWKAANPDSVREYDRKGHSKYRASSPARRITLALRGRLYHAVKDGAKSGSAVRDLGCSIEDFKVHIESQFQPGMSWDNWNCDGWGFDHDYPCAPADMNDRAQLLAVCNWRNLRPMWHGDNVRKGDEVSESARERFEVLANFLEVMQ
jgi:hypothetical protein